MPLILLWTNSDTGGLETFQLDVVTSLTHLDESTVTEHAVEEGVVISDHIRPNPDRVSVEGIITNTPHSGNLTEDDRYSPKPLDLKVPVMNQSGTTTLDLDVPSPKLQPNVSSLLDAGLGALGKLISGGPTATMNTPAKPGTKSVTVTVAQPDSPRNRARDAYDKLLAAKLAGELITCDTGMRAYFDMVVERIEQPQVMEDGESRRFSFDLRKLRISESATVEAPKPTEVRAAKPSSLGSQAAKEDANEPLHSHAYDAGVKAGVIRD